jgi:hypothetical protein
MKIHYYEKYIKYKTKYNELKKQIGGFPLLNINKHIDYTAVYVYTKDNHGVFYFALSRKVPLGARKRLKSGANTGAAGTNIEYFGKWGSFGGGAEKNSTALKAAIDELNDEANLNGFFNKNNISILWKNNNIIDSNKLNLMLANEYNNVGIFLFFLPNYNLFFNMFPKLSKNGRRGPELVESSSGEIDAVCSLNFEEMYQLQIIDNTMFLHYFCDSFNKIIKPYIMNESHTFKTKWQNIDLIVNNDKNPRIPSELPVKKNEYIEGPRYKYR